MKAGERLLARTQRVDDVARAALFGKSIGDAPGARPGVGDVEQDLLNLPGLALRHSGHIRQRLRRHGPDARVLPHPPHFYAAESVQGRNAHRLTRLGAASLIRAGDTERSCAALREASVWSAAPACLASCPGDAGRWTRGGAEPGGRFRPEAGRSVPSCCDSVGSAWDADRGDARRWKRVRAAISTPPSVCRSFAPSRATVLIGVPHRR